MIKYGIFGSINIKVMREQSNRLSGLADRIEEYLTKKGE